MSARTRRSSSLARAVALTLASAVLSAVAVGVVTAPGLPRPARAGATTPNPRLCSGVGTSGTFTAHDQGTPYDLYVPQNSVVTVSGAVDMVTNQQIDWYVDPFGSWLLGSTSPGSQYTNLAFSRTWTNSGPSGYVLVRPHWGFAGIGPLVWRMTVTVSPGGACVDPKNTLGSQCAGRNLGAAQPQHADPVNSATGNLHEELADFSIPARGLGLALSHSYNSLQAGVDGPLGYGWTHSYAVSLAVDSLGVATVTQEGGATLPFYPLGAGGYTVPPWAVATLVKNADNSFTMTRCNALTLQFSAGGQLQSIADRNGYATTLQYSAGKLSTVTDTAGRQLHFTWTGSHITSASDSSTPARTVTFAYNDGAGNLTDYTDAGGASWKYTYDAHRLQTLRRPRQAGVPGAPVTTNVYDAQNRVVSQTDELLRTTLFDYTSIPGSTKVTDPKNNVVLEQYQGGVLTRLTRGYGTPSPSVWLFEHDGTAGVTKATDPDGHVTVATYDLDGNTLTARTRSAT